MVVIKGDSGANDILRLLGEGANINWADKVSTPPMSLPHSQQWWCKMVDPFYT